MERLRVALYGSSNQGESGAYTLDKGERNDDELSNGALGPRLRPIDDCMTEILREHACSIHKGDESCCYVPKAGSRFVGEHLRMDLSIRGLLARHMVSTLFLNHLLSNDAL
jgi:hypothetical protein